MAKQTITEQQYIDTTNLAKVRCALAVVRQVIAQNDGHIRPEEYGQVAGILSMWEERLAEIVKTKD